MCRRRQVRTIFKRCNHAVTAPDEEVRCDSTQCIFSPNHPATCSGEACKKRCWQYRPAPQQYTEEKETYCPYCAAAGCR
ncbi:hypothetical protein ONZ51_g4545 [Trametes cubensis]|uniref:Uncharacterized protein n=1 Tax=Trametes cubensis TaxID=1111947 RepID=A0AAD7TY27_9APHY|nr:hypothetical protein ONZ51_g4545 [Trametes cubensis]